MGLLVAETSHPNRRLVALALASGVPFAAYLATGSAFSYWFDGGELTAQAVHLDIAHSPGHPLSGLWGKLCTLLPLGPIPLRLALGQAACAAAAAGFLYVALERTVRSLGVARDRVVVPLSVGGTWLAACSHAWWSQAVQPDVHALQALCVLIVVERLVALEVSWPTLDYRPLYLAGLVFGLGFANHPATMLLVLPAAAPTLARAYRARGGSPLIRTSGAVLMGFGVLAYLPVRAATRPPSNLGDPSDLGRLAAVFLGRSENAATALATSDSWVARLYDALAILGRNVGGVWGAPEPADELFRALIVLALASAGAYSIFRTPGARRVGVVWALLLAVGLASRTWAAPGQTDRDVLGVLMPTLAAVAVLLTALVAAMLVRLGQRLDGTPRFVAILVALGLTATGGAQLRASSSSASLTGFHGTDDFDAVRVRALPARAVVIAYRPQTIARHWGTVASEGARPDVRLVPIPYLDRAGVVEALVARDSDLAELLRGYLLEGELRQADLQSLAGRRPVLVELDPRLPQPLWSTLLPRGLFYEVSDSGVTRTDIRASVERYEETLRELYRHLGAAEQRRPQTRAQLLHLHTMDALYFAASGEREPALAAVERGLALTPSSALLMAVREALGEGEGRVDVAPFLAAPPHESP